jgi:hypothetical protein
MGSLQRFSQIVIELVGLSAWHDLEVAHVHANT